MHRRLAAFATVIDQKAGTLSQAQKTTVDDLDTWIIELRAIRNEYRAKETADGENNPEHQTQSES